jgi:hypothetical protein
MNVLGLISQLIIIETLRLTQTNGLQKTKFKVHELSYSCIMTI